MLSQEGMPMRIGVALGGPGDGALLSFKRRTGKKQQQAEQQQQSELQ
jgi:hypothetical protein